MKKRTFLHRLFSVKYWITRDSGLWWCSTRKIWTNLDDNIYTLSNTADLLTKKALKKQVETIPDNEGFRVLKIRWLFFKRSMIAYEYAPIEKGL